MEILTIKQKMLLEAIEWYITEFEMSPSIRELSDLLKSHPSAVFQKLMILEEKGYVSTKRGKARSIRVLRRLEDET